MRKQNVIIFSSGNMLEQVHSLAKELEDEVSIEVWDSLFDKSFQSGETRAIFPFLLKKIPSFDFAIVVASSDDKTYMARNNGNSIEQHNTVRDNVIFELGLAVMALGSQRIVLLKDKAVRYLDDLRGISGCGVEANQEKVQEGDLDIFTIEYDGDFANESIAAMLSEHIDTQKKDYSPVVIGASCATAIGYVHNFINSFSEAYTDAVREGELLDDLPSGFLDCNKVSLQILIPENMNFLDKDNDIKYVIRKDYCEKNNIKTNLRLPGKVRPVGFCLKEEDGHFYVIDIPTTLVASYETASKILKIETNEHGLEDDKTKERFLLKELDHFENAVKILVGDNDYPFRVEVKKIEIG